MTRTIRTLVAVTLGGLSGCSSSGSVNLGGNQNPGGTAAALAGTWTGYAEATMFQPSGSDQVRFVIDAQGNGTVQVGNDPLLPAPTDPNMGFPQDLAADAGAHFSIPVDQSLSGGVLYPMHATQFGADGAVGRIQFGLNPGDFYSAWCALQTPNYIVTGCLGLSGPQGNLPVGGFGGKGGTDPTVVYGYSISPGVPWDSSEQNGTLVCTARVFAADCTYADVPIDCGKFALTSNGVCACTATSCTSWPASDPGTSLSGYSLAFDGLLDSSGKSLTGTLSNDSMSPVTRVTIHLARQ